MAYLAKMQVKSGKSRANGDELCDNIVADQGTRQAQPLQFAVVDTTDQHHIVCYTNHIHGTKMTQPHAMQHAGAGAVRTIPIARRKVERLEVVSLLH